MVNANTMTPQQIREAGMAALARELGIVGMIRFMQQFELGKGDYSIDRHEWLDQYSVDDIVGLVGEKKTDYKRKKSTGRS
jgi:hypothetical protein